MNRPCSRIVLLGWLISAGFAAPVQAETKKPNIIVILSDDMGFSDLGCYGGEIQTPVLDRLAAGGVRFSQFYNTARCCPTRASLLTGLYPHQAGVGHMVNDRGHDGYRGDLNQQCVTIAQVLKTAGYRNYIAGKWHVTKHILSAGPKDNWPLQRGFDRYYGTIIGGGTYYDPAGLTRDNTMLTAGTDPDYRPARYYYTDAISDHAVRFLADHKKQNADQPFFMYVAYTAAHWPMHALEEDIAKYQGKYDAGYQATRAARFEKAQKLGLIDPAWKLSPTAENWESVKDKTWESRCMEVYAAMVDRMDQGIGKIVGQLEQQGDLDNTLILYVQDNGGCAETVGRQPDMVRQEKPTLPVIPADQILSGSRPPQTREGYPMLTGRKVMPGPADTFMAYGEGWANASNTPFRMYKHFVHEGGISTPAVAHWPAGIKAKGELRKEPAHLIDIMATCVDLAAAKYPETHDGQTITPMEGKSLVPVFASKPIEREAIYWEHEGNRAVRAGAWKLVAKGKNGPWELYNLEADRTEQNNLAGSERDRVEQLAALWQKWAERAQVLPLDPSPEGAGKKKDAKKAAKKGAE